MSFPHTQWTLLARAALAGDEGGREALAQFYRLYREPVLAFLRRRPIAGREPEDLAQSFFVHLLEKELLARADLRRGRFRSFLLGALVHFLGHEREKQGAAKRGGGVEWVAFDETQAEASSWKEEALAYDQAWALGILARSLSALEEDYRKKERGALFSHLRGFLPGAGGGQPSYAETAADLGITEASLKSEIHRVRHRLREFLQREIAATVAAPMEVDEEIAYLGRVLRSLQQ